MNMTIETRKLYYYEKPLGDDVEPERARIIGWVTKKNDEAEGGVNVLPVVLYDDHPIMRHCVCDPYVRTLNKAGEIDWKGWWIASE